MPAPHIPTARCSVTPPLSPSGGACAAGARAGAAPSARLAPGMSSWIQGALEKTAGVRQAAYDRATGAAAYAQEVAGSAGANIAAGAEKVRSTDVRTLASQAAEGAAAQTAGLREAAQQKAAGAQVGMMDAFSQANARAYTMEGRMRMEAAVAADYAQQVKYRGDRVVKQKIRGEQGPPTADEVVEMMNEMAAEIRGGSNVLRQERLIYIIPPMPPMSGIAGIGAAASAGFSATIASVVINRPATDAAS